MLSGQRSPFLLADYDGTDIAAVAGPFDVKAAEALCATVTAFDTSVSPPLDLLIDASLLSLRQRRSHDANQLIEDAARQLSTETEALRLLARLFANKAIEQAALFLERLRPRLKHPNRLDRAFAYYRRQCYRDLLSHRPAKNAAALAAQCDDLNALALRLGDPAAPFVVRQLLRSAECGASVPVPGIASAPLLPAGPWGVATDGTPTPPLVFSQRAASGDFILIDDVTLTGRRSLLQRSNVVIDDTLPRHDDPAEFDPFGTEQVYHDLLYRYVRFADDDHRAIVAEQHPRRRLARGILFCGPYQASYYHWLVEYLSKLPAIHRLPPKYDDWPLLVCQEACTHPSLVAAFEQALAPHPRPIELIGKDECVEVAQLLVPPHTAWLKTGLTRVHIDAHDILLAPAALRELSTFLALPGRPSRRFFLARRKNDRLTNQDEMSRLFAAHGFETLYPEDLDFSTARELFRDTDLLAGPPGSAFANLLLCPPGTTAIVLMPDIGPQAAVFSSLASALGQRLINLCGPTDDPDNFHSRFCADPEAAQRLLTHLDAMPRTAPPPFPVADTRTTLCTAPGVPLVSILIPAYKPRWFERALRSALAQDYQNLEILVFDNCPNEDIRDICARYPLVTYYRNPNMGPQNSLDIASASRGRYVKHLFDDDLLEPDCVSALVEAIERAPGTLLAFGASWTIDENDQRTGLRQEIETPETVHLYDGNALCRAFATTCANMIGEFTSVLMDGHWLREDVLRLRRAEALNRELFGLCDVICFMNAAADRPVAFVNRPLTSFRINSESNSNPERNPAFIEAITDWREIIAEAEARGLLTPDERGIARNSYNLRATGMGQTFAGLCAGIAPTLFAPDELPAHAVVEACLVLIHAGRSDEAAPRLIALAEAQSAHPGVFAMLAELALGSGELAVAARFSERSVSLQAYPLSACAAHLALLEKHGLHEVATAFRADALRRHPEAPDLISPTPKAEPADDRFAPPLPPCPMTAAPSEAGLPAPYQRWQVRRTQGGLQADDYQRRVACLWKRRPLFEIVLVVGTGEKTLLADSIDALAAQYYDGWRLSIFAHFSSPDAEFLAPDSPVRWFALTRPEDPEALATAIDCRLAESRADWISFLACGTRLAPEALLCIGDYLALHPDWRLIYSDEDTLAADGTGEAPQFKPDFNLELLRATDYLGGVFVERAALCAAGGYARCPGGETYDLALRLVDHAGEAAIGHIPEVLQRRPVSARTSAEDDAARQALAAHFARRGIDAEILPGLIDGQSRRPVYRHTTRPLVSIIVPTRNRLDLLAPCVESLFANTAYPNWELIIVDNGNPEPATTHYFAELRAAQPQRVRIMAQPGDFDFARLNNHAAELAHGDYLLLLNDDTQCIHDDWLDALLAHAQRPEVGIVGARLLFPDSLKVQHAGVVLGMSGSAGHVFSNLDHDAPAYLGRAQLDQEYSAVTGACLLIRRQLYRELDGLDGATFKISYNDIDLCLKVRQRGLKIIYTPHATLLHHGSASQKGTPLTSEKSALFQQETAAFLTRWRHWLQADPAWSRHLSLSDSLPTLESEIVPAWNSDFQDRPRILTMPSPSPGAAEYRNLAPLRALHAAGRVHYAATCQPCAGFERAPTPVELARAAPDTLLIHAAVDDLRGRALQQYRRVNPEVLRIFSLDDLITDLPRDNPSAAHLPPALIGERLRLGLAASDRLIVSTQPLLDAYRHWIDDIRLLPNRLSTDLWGGVRARRRHGAKARVGWAGAQQHAGDLRFLLDVVRATHTEVDWIFLGMLPEGTEAYVTEYHPYVTLLAEYPAKLASLDLDLAIAPLEVHPFNEAKSNLRLLEYGYLGWPVICTDILPYQTDDPPVLRLPNDPARWIAAIRERVAERDALACSGDALQAWVHRHYLLESYLDEWYAALTR